MKKIYPIMIPTEVNNYNRNTSIDMEGLPSWLLKEMEKIAKIENCDVRELRYKRELYYDSEELRWSDSGIIIFETPVNN